MTELGELADGTDKFGLAEELTGLGTDLTTDDVFLGLVVTIDYDLVDGGLRSFDDTHLKVDGVTNDF